MADAPRPTKKRVVILGGGVGGMITALNLTDPRNPRRDEYDVTLYQLGWRLGGKGASGRNMDPAYNYRIEEHGLHVWFGCYDNAFRQIQTVYDELNRPPDAPLARWDNAFKPHTAGGTLDFTQGQWRTWLEAFPLNDVIPGQGGLLPMHEYAREGYQLMHTLLQRGRHTQPSPTGSQHPGLPPGSSEGANQQKRGSSLEDGLFKILIWLFARTSVLAFLLRLGEGIALGMAGWFLRWRWSRIKNRVGTIQGSGERHYWLFANAIYAVLRGFYKNRVFERGFKSQNGVDFRDWLARYCIDDGGFMVNSEWLRGIYDGMFAYQDGDNRTPPGAAFPPNAKCEAGVMLYCGLRQYATYKGAAVWRMQAGMGDVVFAPMYEVLKKRGVKIKLFHRVQALKSADGRSLTAIDISRQATVKPEQEARGGYDPLVTIKGLPCWPSTPLYDQLVEGEALRAQAINLEDYCAKWEPVERIELLAGRDFDEAVMAISLGAIPYLCGDLIRANEKWRDMVQHVLTNKTLSAQFWLCETASQLGWALMQRPLISSYDITYLDTWADMSYLIQRENWHMRPPRESNRPIKSEHGPNEGVTATDYPMQLSYFCGPMPDEPPLPMTPVGPKAECGALDQDRENAKAKDCARTLLEKQIATFFPNAMTPGPGPLRSFRWELLVDGRPGQRHGIARFDSQYFHANVQPSERYVLSLPGSDQYRLAPNESQFARLTLAGDWTECGLNAGCVEAAVMAGMLASNNISQYPARSDIVGLSWWR